MRSRPASSLPAMSRYRDAQLPSPSPPDAVQDRCLGPVAFVRWLPSSVAFAIARPRPQSKTAVQDRCLRHRLRCLRPLPACVFAPCHVTLAAMRSCLRHRHRCSCARSRPWPCHATAMRSCLRHRHRCSRSPRCPQTDKRPQTVRQKTLDSPEELSARVTLRPDACIHPFVRSRRHRHRCSPRPLPCKTVALSRHLSPSPCPDIHPFPMPASIAASMPSPARSRP